MNNTLLNEGLWPVMLTPFHRNNEVDYGALDELTNFYIRSGAAGLFANCLSGEMFQLTDDERLKVISGVVKIASEHGLKVVASGTMTGDAAISASFIKRVYDTGVAAVVIISNQPVKMEEEEDAFKAEMEKLLRLTGDIPLGLYECPYPYKRLISVQMLQWIRQSGRFLYMKDTSCDEDQIAQKIEVLEGSACRLYNANTATALFSLDAGAAGLSPIGANFYPEIYSHFLRAYRNGAERNFLKDIHQRLTVMEGIAVQSYPASAKIFLQKRGLKILPQCRIPHQALRKETFHNLESLYSMYKKTLEEFQI